MSKSKGTFITADDFATKYDPELLRYYFASKLNNKIEDINFDTAEFTCLLYTSPSPRDQRGYRMPSSA